MVWSVAYKSYGNIALAHENQIEQPIRFQGQYYDEETGPNYNRFRYYDPVIGQFISQDPVGLFGGVNNYRYVPNPITWIDPLGLECKEISLSDIKFKSVWSGEYLEFYVRDDDGNKLYLGLAELSEYKGKITFSIFNDNDGVKLKPVGFGLTEALLSISILEFMGKNNGLPPSSLPGGLSKSNKCNYQKEYSLALGEGLDPNDAKGKAIVNVSFGKHRKNMGYEDIEVQHSRSTTTVTHDAKAQLLEAPLDNVPDRINVTNAKLTDKSKLDKTLEKYKEAYESGREDDK
ncbi:RHS repeat-associated core domain-containing protein [Microbulbifer variabilis]|uniref:RHS repeat-associated core domain-containing protein n=1 Tax=Microbulbifer variabilis TaxID=266805 RepID=UPI00299D901C|nr:RHS repeat-associated core domain-containing protein [Microbulbifer variabilis]